METDAPVVGPVAPTGTVNTGFSLWRFDRTFSGWRVIPDEKNVSAALRSASPRCGDGGDVDLLHRHHRFEGALCLIAASRKRIG